MNRKGFALLTAQVNHRRDPNGTWKSPKAQPVG